MSAPCSGIDMLPVGARPMLLPFMLTIDLNLGSQRKTLLTADIDFDKLTPMFHAVLSIPLRQTSVRLSVESAVQKAMPSVLLLFGIAVADDSQPAYTSFIL